MMLIPPLLTHFNVANEVRGADSAQNRCVNTTGGGGGAPVRASRGKTKKEKASCKDGGSWRRWRRGEQKKMES